MITKEQVHQLSLGLQHSQAVIRQIRDNIHTITKLYVNVKREYNDQNQKKNNEIEKRNMASEQKVPENTKGDRFEEISEQIRHLFYSINTVHKTVEVLLTEAKQIQKQVEDLNKTQELIRQFDTVPNTN
jgi:archaellum component FlaC